MPLRYRNIIPSSWVHESEYPALKLCRPALGKQVTVFLHGIKELFKRTQAEHSIVQEKALSIIGLSRRVPALYICPMTIDAQAIRLKSVIGSDKYDLVVKRPYSPPANVFQVALCQLWIHKLCGIYTANATGSEGGDLLVFCSQLIIHFFAKDLLRSSRMGRPMTSCIKP